MFGEKSLSNSELLAIIIKTGTKEKTAINLAQSILTLKNGNDIRSLQELSLEELRKIKGIGRVKAIQIKAICEIAKRMTMPLDLKIIIKGPEDVAKIFSQETRYEKIEIAKLLILNTKNVLQKIIDLSIGRNSSTQIDIRRILEEVLKTGMSKFILIHNHPSGDPTPSKQDLQVTKNIQDASQIMGLELLDHIILGENSFYSILAKSERKMEIL